MEWYKRGTLVVSGWRARRGIPNVKFWSSDRALKGSIADGGFGGLRTIQKCTLVTAARARTATVTISHSFLVTISDCMR